MRSTLVMRSNFRIYKTRWRAAPQHCRRMFTISWPRTQGSMWFVSIYLVPVGNRFNTLWFKMTTFTTAIITLLHCSRRHKLMSYAQMVQSVSEDVMTSYCNMFEWVSEWWWWCYWCCFEDDYPSMKTCNDVLIYIYTIKLLAIYSKHFYPLTIEFVPLLCIIISFLSYNLCRASVVVKS